MTFLNLQHQIVQTRKARRGTSNRIDYYEDNKQQEDFDAAVYQKALNAANKVVKHFYEKGSVSPKDKIIIDFKDAPED